MKNMFARSSVPVAQLSVKQLIIIGEIFWYSRPIMSSTEQNPKWLWHFGTYFGPRVKIKRYLSVNDVITSTIAEDGRRLLLLAAIDIFVWFWWWW